MRKRIDRFMLRGIRTGFWIFSVISIVGAIRALFDLDILSVFFSIFGVVSTFRIFLPYIEQQLNPPVQEMEEIRTWRRKELSYREIAEMDRLTLMMPKTLLRSWGFDPHQEIVWWNDDARDLRVYQQEVR